jgi:hypothetical protein
MIALISSEMGGRPGDFIKRDEIFFQNILNRFVKASISRSGRSFTL